MSHPFILAILKDLSFPFIAGMVSSVSSSFDYGFFFFMVKYCNEIFTDLLKPLLLFSQHLHCPSTCSKSSNRLVLPKYG